MFASDYRRIARQSLKGSWPLSIAVAAVALLLGGIISGTAFFPEVEVNLDNQQFHNMREAIAYALEYIMPAFSVALVLDLIGFVIGGTIQMGQAQYLLDQHDGLPLEFKTLFSKFDRFGVGFLQALLRGIFVFLWSLLFVIPGIVAAYRYAMTPFILAENPNMTASEAIRASKELMQGHKWRLFCLDFSFIGWSFLCGLTANLGYIVLNPYECAAHAAFYRDISGTTHRPEAPHIIDADPISE